MKTFYAICLTWCLSYAAGARLPFLAGETLEDPSSGETPTVQVGPYYPVTDWIRDEEREGLRMHPWVLRQDFEAEEEGVLQRQKRQSRDLAMDLALSHQDHAGNPRPVGQLHGRVDLQGSGQSARDYVAHGDVGVGSVLWRSPNDRHSIGAGAYASQTRARFNDFRYRSRPDVGFGLGYRFRF